MAGSDDFRVEEHPEAIVVHVGRRTLDEPASNALHDEILSLTSAAGARAFIIDLIEVEIAPSVAIGMLVKLSKSFKLDNRRLMLAAVQRRVYKTLAVTRVTTLLELYESVAAALAAARKPL